MREISAESAALLLSLLDQVTLSGADPDLEVKATAVATARRELTADHA